MLSNHYWHNSDSGFLSLKVEFPDETRIIPHNLQAQLTQDVEPMVVQCWASIISSMHDGMSTTIAVTTV